MATPAPFHVLLIEDSPDDRADLRQMLLLGSPRRYKFTEADTGAAGIRAVFDPADSPPDCVLLDHNLPDMDAVAVLAALHAGGELTVCPVVVVTGSLELGTLILRAGAQEFLGKSWATPESVTRAIDSAVERHVASRERKVAEAALQNSESHLRYALQAARAGAWDWDIRSGDIVWSPENYRLYDFDPAQGPPCYADWDSRVHPEDRASANEHVRAVLEGRETEFRTEFRVVGRQGAVRWLLGLGRVERDQDGQPLRMSGLNLDITERRLAEAQVRQLNHELEERVATRTRELEQKAAELLLTSGYKSEFLATMSHELRTPLNSLLILSRALADNKTGNLTARQIEWAQTIHGSGADLLKLIDEVLDFSKVAAGKVTISPAVVTLGSVLKLNERTFRPVAEHRHLSFTLVLDPGLPATLLTDAYRLQQILSNLLANAFKFTSQGGVTFSVAPTSDGWEPHHERLNRAPRVIAFAVRDTGIGLASEKQGIIFEAFRQAETGTAREYGGTGLGLAISRDLAHLLGGTLRVESELGVGSTFTLYLPDEAAPDPGRDERTRVAPAVATGPQGASAPPDGSAAILRNRTVLVVDDDARNVFALVSLLEDHEVEVLTAAGGRAAIDRITSTPGLDLVLMDMMMPEMDGYETIREIRKSAEFRALPILALTARAMNGDREKCLAAGASDYIAKPVNTDQLLSLMRLWLSR